MSPTLLWALLLVAGPEPAPVVRALLLEVPAEESARLQRYLTVKTGEPLSQAAIRDSVALLHATGALADVIVETRPAEDGIQVRFRGVPAPRLRSVLVEGDRILGPSAVRRITGLQRREPLWPARLERAARDAAVALTERGYLEARVTAAAVPTSGGAHAVFTITSGRRAHVRRLALEGVLQAEAWGLEPLMRPRAGHPYQEARARAAQEAIRKALVSRGRWKARVDLRPVYDPRFARLDLTFHVDAGPPMRLEFEGERVPRALQREVETLIRDGAAADTLEEAVDRLEEHFRRQGHRNAVVGYREEARTAGAAIVYHIQPGPRTVAASVQVLGDVTPAVPLQTRTIEPVEDRRLAADTAALAAALENLGHATPRVQAEAPEGGQVPVVFRVHAGPRTTVRSFEVQTPTEAPPSGTSMRSQIGSPYRLQDLAHDRDVVLASYRNGGYMEASVEPEIEFSQDRSQVDLRLRVSPGPQTRVGRIVIAGLERTREAVVRRELTLREGDPLSLQGVLDSQQRLGALGLFSRVEVRDLDPEGSSSRDLVIQAEEAPQTTVAYGIGYGERELLRASAEVTRRNLAGSNRDLTVFARGSFRGSRFLTTFRVPYLWGRKQELFLSGFREEEDRESFDFVRHGVLVQTAFGLPGRVGLILRYVYQETDSFNEQVPCAEVDRQFCDSTVSGPSASLFDDTRDDPLDPRRGHLLAADFQFSHPRLGGDSFVKGFAQASAFAPIGPRVVLALGSRVGLARTIGLDEPLRLPLPERFFAGGDHSLRGFQVDAVAPEGGNALFLAGAEVRVDATDFLSVAAFGEAGNVYPLASDIDPADLRYTAGLGLRYKSVLGPLRVDWGYKLNRRPGEPPSRWHVTIGHAF